MWGGGRLQLKAFFEVLALRLLIIWKNILCQIFSSIIFEMHTAPGACSKYSSGAVCIQIMLLEHIWLRIFFQIINGPGPYGPGAACPAPYGPGPVDSRPKSQKSQLKCLKCHVIAIQPYSEYTCYTCLFSEQYCKSKAFCCHHILRYLQCLPYAPLLWWNILYNSTNNFWNIVAILQSCVLSQKKEVCWNINQQ